MLVHMLTEVRKRFKEWGEKTTCHGLPDYVGARNKCFRSVWLFVILFSCIALTCQLIDVIGTFAKSKLWATSLYQEILVEESMTYPTITFCNYNRIKQSAAETYHMTDDYISLLFSMIYIPYPVTKNQFSEEIRTNYTKWRQKRNLTVNKIFLKMGQKCNEMIIKMSLSINVIGEKNKVCESPELLVKSVLTEEFGLCHQITLVPDWNNVSFSGKMSGLSFILSADSEDYLTLVENNYLNEGFALQLHYDDRVEVGKWLEIAPGFHTSIALKQKRSYLTMPTAIVYQPFNLPCNQNLKMNIYPNEHYSVETCIADCFQSEFARKCKCLIMMTSTKFPVCEVEQHLKCNEKVDITSIMECSRRCVEPCQSKSVETSVTMTRFPSQNQLKSLSKILMQSAFNMSDLSNIQRNFAAIDIYFDTLAVQMIEHYQRLTLGELIGSVGGQLGLWAGISIVTLFQAMVYICSCCIQKEIEEDE